MENMLRRRARLLTMVSGSLIVSVWTLFRHITNGVNFDIVGQIGLADQWVQGLHAGVQLGTTNYLLKIPLYLVVNTLDFLSPMNRLLLLALAFNIATFLLLFILFEKILKLYGVKDKNWLYLAMLWLATICGSVFWVDYANSRNLETVGGILFIYLVLKLLSKPRGSTAALIVLAGSVTFFADSLQLYVCGVGACAFVCGRWLWRRTGKHALDAARVVGLTALGYIGALLLGFVARHALNVSFLTAPHNTTSFEPQTLQGILRSTLDIFGANFIKAPYGLNTIRELLSFCLLLTGVLIITRVITKNRSGTVVWFGLATIGVNYLVYIASGQVLVWATARYLIMVPLLLALLLAVTGERFAFSHQKKLQIGWLAVVSLSVLMLVGALAVKWPERHSKDQHIYATVAFLEASHTQYALSSREVGITTTFFAQGETTVLPMLCTSERRLTPTHLFYDRTPFRKAADFNGSISIILPLGGIVSGEFVCSEQDIEAQFGVPADTSEIPGTGRALVYPAGIIRPDVL
jgi:hypothetical protein